MADVMTKSTGQRLRKPKYKISISESGDDSPAFQTHHTNFQEAKRLVIEEAQRFANKKRVLCGAPEQSSQVSVTHQSGGEDSTVFRVIVTYPDRWSVQNLMRMYTVSPIASHAPEINDLTMHLANY